MGAARNWLAILVLLLVGAYDAFAYDYSWNDCRSPFTQLVRVPTYTSGSSTVYLDLPEDLIATREDLTLNLDIESNLLLKIDGLEQRTFERWSAYCSVNGAGFFGKHRLRVLDLPARQTCSIVIATKDLKAGRNTLEFSMSPTGANADWRGTYGKMGIAYGIHRMWFSELSAPPQEPTVQEVKKEVPSRKAEPRDVWHIRAVSSSQMSRKGNRCGESTVTLIVRGNEAAGTGNSSSGGSFEISGSVDSKGLMNVGVASGNNVFATFTGVLSGDSGSGIWQDESQCYGTWSATKEKQMEPIAKQPDSHIETEPGVIERIKLRDRAEKNFGDQDLQRMIKERNFWSRQYNVKGNFRNAFLDNGNGTVTDKVTGLMWQKSGSPSEMTFNAAGNYVQGLNSSRFGGYGDWRLPTMEELCSLLEGTSNKSGRFIDNLFDPVQTACWSADENQQYSGTSRGGYVKAAFCVSFSGGETSAGNAERFQPTNQSRYYVRAVRTAE